MNIGTGQQHAADPADLPGILSREDQRKAFGKARRHTIAVRFLKYLFPVLSLCIVSLYFLPERKNLALLDLPVSVKDINLSGKGLKMINPRYTGGSDKIGRYKVEAEYALQQVTATNILELYKITGQIEQQNNKWTRLTANKGIYDTSTEQMTLKGNVLVSSSQGMEARLESAAIDMKKQVIASNKPVQVKLNGNEINALTMKMFAARKRVLFKGGVKVKLFMNKSMTN